MLNPHGQMSQQHPQPDGLHYPQRDLPQQQHFQTQKPYPTDDQHPHQYQQPVNPVPNRNVDSNYDSHSQPTLLGQVQEPSLVHPCQPAYISLPQCQPQAFAQQAHHVLSSPYETPQNMPMSTTPLSPEQMTDYFSTRDSGQSAHQKAHKPLQQPVARPPLGQDNLELHLQSPSEWQSHAPKSSRKTGRMTIARGGASGSGGTGNGAKTSRQQFTACGACRHRRVKCDLKDRQEEADKLGLQKSSGTIGPKRGNDKPIQCSNCIERGMNCVDEYAPIKAAKQLRRGKRISEIEQLYGKNAATAAVEHHTSIALPIKEPLVAVKASTPRGRTIIPELTPEFFESAFFKRFQVQRPVIDPASFTQRYLSRPTPTAAAMGPEGAILCHVLYAWAVSYGVDEYGHLDVPEGGGTPLTGVNLIGPGEEEAKRENDRARRFEKMKLVIEVILNEIDDCGILRKPTWDGVRVLLIVLPLTEGISSPVERLTMYDSALSQVFTLCSFAALNYDGRPSGTASVNGGEQDERSMAIVRVRVYWYAFVHEGITAGLKGGRLHLDDEDLETIQDSIEHSALVKDSAAFRISSRFATAPINLALACRKINKALTGPSAKRCMGVNAGLVKQSWEALESCWEEFDQLLETVSNNGSGMYGDEIVRFADGWKIFLFEAQNVIRNNLEERLNKLSNTSTAARITARITDSDSPPSHTSKDKPHSDIITISHLHEIAKSKCEFKTRQILELVKKHVGTRFFEWDASLVRDGTFYAARWLARAGGSEEDVAACIQALNELRWAHAKSWRRSAELRQEWKERSLSPSAQEQSQQWESVVTDLGRLSGNSSSSGHAPSQPDGSVAGTSGTSSGSHSSIQLPYLSHHNQTHDHPDLTYHQQPLLSPLTHPYQSHNLNLHLHHPHSSHQYHHLHETRSAFPMNVGIPPIGSPYTTPPIISPLYEHGPNGATGMLDTAPPMMSPLYQHAPAGAMGLVMSYSQPTVDNRIPDDYFGAPHGAQQGQGTIKYNDTLRYNERVPKFDGGIGPMGTNGAGGMGVQYTIYNSRQHGERPSEAFIQPGHIDHQHNDYLHYDYQQTHHEHHNHDGQHAQMQQNHSQFPLHSDGQDGEFGAQGHFVTQADGVHVFKPYQQS